MRRVSYYVGVSLDGCIATPTGGFDCFPVTPELIDVIVTDYPETLPTHVRESMGIDPPNRRFDTVVMGRGTHQPAIDAGIASPYRHLEQHVVSSSLGRADGVHVRAADPLGLLRELKAQPGLDIWLAGGGVLAGAVLAEVDQLVLKRYPVTLGSGIPVISGPAAPVSWTVTDARTVGDGVTITTYDRSG